MNNIIRNINIHLLTDIELDEPYLTIHKYINELKSLNKYETNIDSVILYGRSKNDIVLEIDNVMEAMWIYRKDFCNSEMMGRLSNYNIHNSDMEETFKYYLNTRFNNYYKTKLTLFIGKHNNHGLEIL